MDKAYIIMSGAYSDWMLKGFCESREEAEKVCALHNSNMDDYEYEWYIMEADRLMFDDSQGKIKVVEKWDVSVRFDAIHEKWDVLEPRCPELLTAKSKKYKQYKKNQVEKRGPIYYEVHVICERGEAPEKVQKIAQDLFYKYLAEREGL